MRHDVKVYQGLAIPNAKIITANEKKVYQRGLVIDSTLGAALVRIVKCLSRDGD